MKRFYEKALKIKVENIHGVIITVLSAVIGILVVLIVLGKFPIIPQFVGQLKSATNYQSGATDQQLADAQKRNAELEFDRIRMQDVSNIILATQEFYFQKGSLPPKLASLKDEGFLDAPTSFNDPKTKAPYFYQDRTNDFVLCVWLSDAVKGVNTADCPAVSPSSEASASSTPKPSPSPSASPSPTSTGNTAMGILEIVGNVTYVNVRQGPTTSSAIVAKTKPGDTLQFFAIQDNWYQIVVQGVQGWVINSYTKIISQ